MILEIKIPVIDKDVEEYRVVFWYKDSGEMIKKDEDLVEIETDMEAYTIPADENGILEIVAAEGSFVKANDILYNIKIEDK
jgi:pyruvate/2-oxoglutarate dehydrogenase complex dihydrolipoamide acyltransferase (E2) component